MVETIDLVIYAILDINTGWDLRIIELSNIVNMELDAVFKFFVGVFADEEFLANLIKFA